MKRLHVVSLSLLAVLKTSQALAPPTISSWSSISTSTTRRRKSGPLHMQPPLEENPRVSQSDLSAFASLDTAEDLTSTSSTTSTTTTSTIIPTPSFGESFVIPVVSTSFMITGNAVGAGMLVLPDLVRGSGMMVATGVFVTAYIMNWISGLALAQVAIQQHEQSGSDVPSSFQEFAQGTLPSSANLVSGISIFINCLVLAFNTVQAGHVLWPLVGGGLDPMVVSYLWAALLTGTISTLTLSQLSQVVSVLVVGLFVSFAGLLLPGLASMTTDPMAVFSLPGTTTVLEPTNSPDVILSTMLHMTPVVITTLVYQNIVPTVTRILDYDRIKTMSAITIGSMIPLFMYLAWCACVLGGGSNSSDVTGPLLTLFSVVTVAGSSMGCLMSLAEEFEILLPTTMSSFLDRHRRGGNDGVNGQAKPPSTQTTTTTSTISKKPDSFSWPSVAIPVSMALLASQFFASDIKNALKMAGSFGSPLLYGLLPVAMALSQQKQQDDGNTKPTTTTTTTRDLVPGGNVALGVLGVGATALIGCELMETISSIAPSAI